MTYDLTIIIIIAAVAAVIVWAVTHIIVSLRWKSRLIQSATEKRALEDHAAAEKASLLDHLEKEKKTLSEKAEAEKAALERMLKEHNELRAPSEHASALIWESVISPQDVIL